MKTKGTRLSWYPCDVFSIVSLKQAIYYIILRQFVFQTRVTTLSVPENGTVQVNVKSNQTSMKPEPSEAMKLGNPK